MYIELWSSSETPRILRYNSVLHIRVKRFSSNKFGSNCFIKNQYLMSFVWIQHFSSLPTRRLRLIIKRQLFMPDMAIISVTHLSVSKNPPRQVSAMSCL